MLTNRQKQKCEYILSPMMCQGYLDFGHTKKKCKRDIIISCYCNRADQYPIRESIIYKSNKIIAHKSDPISTAQPDKKLMHFPHFE